MSLFYSGLDPGKNFFFLNFISEMDVEGEYYVDRVNGLLFVIPFSDDTTTPFTLSTISQIMTLTTVSNVTFKNFYIVCVFMNEFF